MVLIFFFQIFRDFDIKRNIFFLLIPPGKFYYYNIITLAPELAMSTPTYDPFGTGPTYKSRLFLCQMGHKQKWT